MLYTWLVNKRLLFETMDMFKRNKFHKDALLRRMYFMIQNVNELQETNERLKEELQRWVLKDISAK